MRRIMLSVASAVALTLPLAVGAATKTYTFTLSADEEIPAVTSSASGTFTLTLDDVADTISFVSVSLGLVGDVILSHIHQGVAGTTGPVRYDLLAAADFAGPLTIAGVDVPGSFAFTGDAKPISSTLIDDINAKPWGYYVNIHSTAFPSGELRGQLAPIPEPGVYALLAMGLGVVGAVARRRRQA